MNRINQLFKDKQHGILNVYFTAGYPALNDTLTIARKLDKAGVDMIEIGIPFSDPVADGPTIQESNKLALHNGITLKLLFQQLKTLRENVDVPVVLMGYVNPVIQYGVEQFCKDCKAVGIDGVILPDLPMDVYQEEYAVMFEQYNLKHIFLITPQTSETRVRQIDELSDGFIYMVSSSSITGFKQGINDAQKVYFNRIKKLNLKTPQLIGFGISDHQSFQTACEYAQGAIVGSAFINALNESDNLSLDIPAFIKNLKNQSNNS